MLQCMRALVSNNFISCSGAIPDWLLMHFLGFGLPKKERPIKTTLRKHAHAIYNDFSLAAIKMTIFNYFFTIFLFLLKIYILGIR